LSLDRPPADHGAARFRYVDPAASTGFLLGDHLQYLVDFMGLHHRSLAEGDQFQDVTAWGKPVYLWGDREAPGVLMAVHDATALPPQVSVDGPPAQGTTRVGFEAAQRLDGADPSQRFQSGLMYLDVTAGRGVQNDFATYRSLMTSLYPQPPLPAWFK